MKAIRIACLTALWTAAPLSGAEGLGIKPLKCGGLQVSRDTLPQAWNDLIIPQRKDFALRGNFCSEYSHAGWEQPMRLYLGEGAAEHLQVIEAGVWLWNTALSGFRQQPVIEVVKGARPRTFAPGSDIWSNRGPASARNVEDGQSVIYFTPSGTAESEREVGGFARMRPEGGRMAEADVYINTATQQEFGYDLALTAPLLRTAEHGVMHALVDPLYFVVAHELGHALGLQHVPIAGNIMSYNYMPAMEGKWLAAAEFLELTLDLTENTWFLEHLAQPSLLDPVVRLTDEYELYMRWIFTRSMSAGEQDRMALMCIYDFTDWNH